MPAAKVALHELPLLRVQEYGPLVPGELERHLLAIPNELRPIRVPDCVHALAEVHVEQLTCIRGPIEPVAAELSLNETGINQELEKLQGVDPREDAEARRGSTPSSMPRRVSGPRDRRGHTPELRLRRREISARVDPHGSSRLNLPERIRRRRADGEAGCRTAPRLE